MPRAWRSPGIVKAQEEGLGLITNLKIIQSFWKKKDALKEIRIKLDEPELRTLLRGGELTLKSGRHDTTVRMLLSDIGFDQIQQCIDDAVEGKDHYKPYTGSMDL